MTDPRVVLDALAHFSRALVRPYDVSEMLVDVCDRTIAALAIDGAGITAADAGGRLRFAASLPEATAEFERAQESLQSGPCDEAFRSGDPVLVTTVATDERWPAFIALVRAAGISSMAGIPMHLDGTAVGALNLYCRQPNPFVAEDVATAQVFADVATAALLRASERERVERVRAQLEHALASRVVIEQAKGVIAARHGIGVDQAFQRLRSHARSRGATLRDVSHAVVHLGLRVDR